MNILLISAVISSGIGSIWSGTSQPRRLFYLFKPLTMVFILLIAILGETALAHYKQMIIAGLVFSLAGDIFLMLPSDHFRAGLATFFAAHLCYITAFITLIEAVHWWLLILCVTYGIGFVYYIFPKLGRQKYPVIAYVVIILIMIWLASEVFYWVPQIASGTIFIGAIFFGLSDLILALNKFQVKFKSARAINLTAYFTAQLLIASSVGLLII